MVFAKEEDIRLGKLKAAAVQLALRNRWEDALAVNDNILEATPEDVDALNRRGKALMELGRYAEARAAYARALEIDRSNTIASKNLERLDELVRKAGKITGHAVAGPKVSPDIFISEVGKSGATVLINSPPDVLTRVTVGGEVYLSPREKVLAVENAKGERIGEVEPKLGLRLLKLIEGENRYTAAVTSLADGKVHLLIKEIFQHESQRGKPSFPPASSPEAFRPYIKQGLVKYDAGEDLAGDDDEAGEWEEARPPKKPEHHIYVEPVLEGEREVETPEPTEEDYNGES